jgi:hypothetical protein
MLLVWLLIAYGQSNIMVYGSIFNGVRDKLNYWGQGEHLPFNGLGRFISDLIGCMMCTSTWVGFFLSIAFYSPSHELFKVHEAASWFFDGMLSSGFVWGFNAVVEWFEENRPTKL